MSTSTETPKEKRYRKQVLQKGQQRPRNAAEVLYFEKYGTVTPLPEPTMRRKNAVQVACILYVHQGTALKEAARLACVDHKHIESLRKEDKWDEFQQELVQLVRPSNLSLVKSHDIDIVGAEQARRATSVGTLVAKEEKIIESLEIAEPGTTLERTLIGNLKSIRDMIGEITGYTAYQKEMSGARQAGLSAVARTQPNKEAPKKAKGEVIDI